jgi:hypothetical protein
MATVKNTKELVKLVVDAYKVYGLAKADGKIDLKDLGLLLTLLPSIEPAFGDVSEIPAEMKDLDAAEASELASYVMAQLGSLPEHTTAIIDSSLGLLIAAYKLYSAIKGSSATVTA